ncbi:Glucose / Sorbosone dehydrogenase [Prosthecobacter debontii]|uniref:Glucose / Sorbosone dehydrogenase n=1 Tax=Prosthecobacter debontii TaxID=48467 RepID=A0A1T4YDA1_9BACT|nr:PQQ-dependent sugar dehydrogenase [Prosthecobacter debontii]SKA99797.1 Glucose / Sorbosone dehydrogenase [Prosthecobacter debontii]
MNLLRCLAFSLFLPMGLWGAFPSLYLKNICDGQIHAPTNITHAGDGSGRLFICDQIGKIYIFSQGMLQPKLFLDLSASGLNRVFVGTNLNSYSERGLLGMTFHPDYEHPFAPGYRRFYVNYTAPASTATDHSSDPQNCVTVIAEFRVSEDDPNLADVTTERLVLSYGQPQPNHNGGQLAFGPDKMLYIGSGDGGSANDNAEGHTGGSGTSSPGRVTGTLGNAQDKTKLLGKILRIDPLGTNGPGGAYGIPTDNPFANSVGMERKEIYAWGLRNPWRLSFDTPEEGPARLFCADVGQNDVEEVDLITSGGNYGWRVKEGSLDFDNTTPYGGGSLIGPIAEYAHPSASLEGTDSMPKYGTSITGGYVYRGTAIPGLQGKYLFGDYAENGIGNGGGVLLGLEETTPGVFALSEVTPFNSLPASARIYAFGEDEAGELYIAVKTTSGVTSLSGGRPAGILYKVQPVAETPIQLTAVADNTLYEPNGSVTSNAKGIYLFAGKTGESANYKVRRAVMKFDVSGLPSDVTFTSAALRLHLNMQVGQDFTMNLHRLSESWGEGTSNAGSPGGNGITATTGDATWNHRFYNTTAWTNPGGDYEAQASASYVIGSSLSDPYPTWQSAKLLEDVLDWKATPSSNQGWILIGDENQTFTAQRFSSRENTTAGNRPTLIVNYASAPSPTHYEAWLAEHFPEEPVGFYLDPYGDLDNDGIFNLHEYAFGRSPWVKDEEPGLTTSTQPGSAGSTLHILRFWRDSAATDLSYQLQTSADLVTWKTIATSLAGTTAIGSNGGVVLSDTPGTGTLRLVTVRETLAAGANSRRFVRLHVTRSY